MSYFFSSIRQSTINLMYLIFYIRTPFFYYQQSATLIAYEICKQQIEKGNTDFNSKFELVLFGCPRVGGEIFKKEFNEVANRTGLQIYSYENDKDIVCKIPFGIFGYTRTFLDSDSVYLEGFDTPFWDIYKNHSMSQYLDILLQGNHEIKNENK